MRGCVTQMVKDAYQDNNNPRNRAPSPQETPLHSPRPRDHPHSSQPEKSQSHIIPPKTHRVNRLSHNHFQDYHPAAACQFAFPESYALTRNASLFGLPTFTPS